MAAAVTQDLEKASGAAHTTTTSSSEDVRSGDVPAPAKIPVPSLLRRLNDRIEGLAGFEARGITRVQPDERQPASAMADLQVTLLWFSANVSVNNLAVGLFGPLVFNLGFLDSAMCAVFGALLGSCSTAYMSIWGPVSGNRTMVSQFEWRVKWVLCMRRLLKVCCVLGCVSILHGLLALQDSLLPEHRTHGWLLHH